MTVIDHPYRQTLAPGATDQLPSVFLACGDGSGRAFWVDDCRDAQRLRAAVAFREHRGRRVLVVVPAQFDAELTPLEFAAVPVTLLRDISVLTIGKRGGAAGDWSQLRNLVPVREIDDRSLPYVGDCAAAHLADGIDGDAYLRAMCAVNGHYGEVTRRLAAHVLAGGCREANLPALAGALCLSRATMRRRVLEECRVPPGSVVALLRVMLACLLSERGGMPTSQLAACIGVRDSRTVRALVRRYTGLSLEQLRATRARIIDDSAVLQWLVGEVRKENRVCCADTQQHRPMPVIESFVQVNEPNAL